MAADAQALLPYASSIRSVLMALLEVRTSAVEVWTVQLGIHLGSEDHRYPRTALYMIHDGVRDDLSSFAVWVSSVGGRT